MLWLMCLGLLLVFKGGAVSVEEDCVVQDQLLIKIPQPGPASFFAYVQHNGSIFTARLICTEPQKLITLNVTSRDVVWKDVFANSKKPERRKSPTSKEGWMEFFFQADTFQLSDADGHAWTSNMSIKCNSFNITVRNGVLAKQLCGGPAKWRVTKDRCAYVHLPPTSNKTLSVNFLSNQSFVPEIISENFTAKLVRRNGEVVLVKDETCSGCQALYGEHNILRFPLSASSQMDGKEFPRAVTVCSASGGSFIVSVRQTQEESPSSNLYIYVAVAAALLVLILAFAAITKFYHHNKNKLPDPPVEEEEDEGPATGCAEELGLPIEALYFNPLFHPGISHQTLPYPVLFCEKLAPRERDIAVDSASCSCQTGRRRSKRDANGTPRATETLPIPGSDYRPDPVQPISAANPVDVFRNPGSRQSCVFPVTVRGQPFRENYYDEMVPLANLRPPSKSFAIDDPSCYETLNNLYDPADPLIQPGSTPPLLPRPSPLLPRGRRSRPLPQEGPTSPPSASTESFL
ncbi:uncharacterized protein LOC125039748 [Penaeus chinensis]|uniref:uncharacterized protein LOC125039748 n=1 Tax=Penaeus chinensis TaxID=139456 RepID=UPI001FB5A95E|nr:uncharacterized protein LOC125039748 [Penaeus chinensis]